MHGMLANKFHNDIGAKPCHSMFRSRNVPALGEPPGAPKRQAFGDNKCRIWPCQHYTMALFGTMLRTWVYWRVSGWALVEVILCSSSSCSNRTHSAFVQAGCGPPCRPLSALRPRDVRLVILILFVETVDMSHEYTWLTSETDLTSYSAMAKKISFTGPPYMI